MELSKFNAYMTVEESGHADEIKKLASMCQSPIEMMLYCAFRATFPSMRISPQVSFSFNDIDREYRADFVVGDFEEPESLFVVVECDGHDYHEKTKDQAIHDKTRDRTFATYGHPVIRFTGSEINTNPIACAIEVYNVYRGYEKRILTMAEALTQRSEPDGNVITLPPQQAAER